MTHESKFGNLQPCQSAVWESFMKAIGILRMFRRMEMVGKRMARMANSVAFTTFGFSDFYCIHQHSMFIASTCETAGIRPSQFYTAAVAGSHETEIPERFLLAVTYLQRTIQNRTPTNQKTLISTEVPCC